MGRRHLTPQEICRNYNLLARESRMTERSTWTTMSIMFGYSMMKGLGFKAKRINTVIEKVNSLYDECEVGLRSFDDLKAKVEEKTGSTYIHEDYTLDDIYAKKGSYMYQYHAVQIPIQNRINIECLKYMVIFNYALIELYGCGSDRLERVNSEFEKIRAPFQHEKAYIQQIRMELMKEAKLWMQDPEDPKNNKYSGSLMTGKVVIG